MNTRTMLFTALLSVTGMSQAAVPGEVIAALNARIYRTAVMSPDGSNQAYPSCLGSDIQDLTHMASPRYFIGSKLGSNVVYIGEFGNPHYNSELVAADEDCEQVVVLSNLGNMTMGNAKWSPDGTMVAFRGHEYAIDEPPPVLLPGQIGSELYLADVVYTGNRPTGVTNLRMVFEGGTAEPHDWAPDSGRLVYAADSGRYTDLYVYTLATGQSVNITNTPDQREEIPSWGSSGRIVYARSVSTRSGVRRDIFSIPEAGGAEAQITSKSTAASPWNNGATYSPDGRYVAFSSCSSNNTINGALGDCALYRIRADGSGKAIKIVGGKNEAWTHARWRR